MKDIKLIRIIGKNWKDPVWSKVIAAGIITTISFLISLIWVIIQAVIQKVTISSAIKQLSSTLLNYTSTPNWLLALLTVISISSILPLLISLIKNKQAHSEEELSNEKPESSEYSDIFFYHRLQDAFPGKRGLFWFDAKEAVKRLKIIFKEPFSFEPNYKNNDTEHDPLWWFRGGDSLHIENFKVLDKDKILINYYEFKLNKIAVKISHSRHLNFIYLDIVADKPSNVYKLTNDQINEQIKEIGFCSERLGFYNGKYFRGEEYDDGSTIIKGKVVSIIGKAELRIKYLSKYNLIICSKKSPFNSHEFDKLSEPYFEDILNNKILPEELFKIMEDFAKKY